MKERIPLGETEDLHLEFKSAESLRKPETVGREVAAMLNTEGGVVWIGLRENDSVAVELQSIPDPEKAADSLLDSLVDRLEPSPLPDEVQVEAVSVSEEMSVLRVQVRRGERGPYALLRNGGRYYQRRVGRRLLPMSREELFRADKRVSRGDQHEITHQKILRERELAQVSARGSMWLQIQPIEKVEIDIHSDLFEELLADPAKTGNRRSGWHFVRASAGPQLRKERISWSHGAALSVEVGATGSMTFLAALDILYWKGEERVFWPIKLLEFPISALRLARVVLKENRVETSILADLALFGIQGWRLRPGSIGSNLSDYEWQINDPIGYPEADEDLIWSRPLEFRFDQLMDEPDRCGYRLVRRVYEAYGCREDRMPREFDRVSGRLVLPS